MFSVAGFAALVSTVACESEPLAPRLRPSPTAPIEPPGESTPVALAEVKCTANREAKTVACDPMRAPSNGVSSDIIIGGQNIYVSLVSSNVNYSGNSFTFDVSVRNLIPQPLGTSNGSTADPAGMKVFFHSGPNVTSGTGTITVNGDGVGSFTGTNQPYFQYVAMIPQYASTSLKTWTLTMPPTVVTFDFIVYVSAPVQFPGGYVQVTSGSTNIRADGVRQITGVSRTAVGNVVPGQTVAWTTSDPSLATVSASGLVSGIREGPVVISASDGTRLGVINLSITPIDRLWSATAASTAAEQGSNWTRGVVPTLNDTLHIPTSTNYPVLSVNKAAASLNVENGASFTLGAFNLTLSRGLTVGTGTTISATSGIIFLTGTGWTVVAGTRLPRITMTGSYTIATNVSSTARLRIDAGKLRVNAARWRIDSQ